MTDYRLSPLAEQDIETILGRVLHDGMDLTVTSPLSIGLLTGTRAVWVE